MGSGLGLGSGLGSGSGLGLGLRLGLRLVRFYLRKRDAGMVRFAPPSVTSLSVGSLSVWCLRNDVSKLAS